MFDESGYRSTFRRTELIADQIYERATPIPDERPSPDRNIFFHEVEEAARETAEAVRAKLL